MLAGVKLHHGHHDVYVNRRMHGIQQQIHVLYGVIVVVMAQITHSMLYVDKKKAIDENVPHLSIGRNCLARK